jgi:oligosaccharide reducing-end xylanase
VPLREAARFAGYRRALSWWLMGGSACVVLLCGGCHGTVDSLGYNDVSGIVLHRMTDPGGYPNAFRDDLGKSDTEIADKLASAFNQLFHGDPVTQAIYVPVAGQNQAYVLDVYHNDIRTQGIGLAMIVALELDKRDEFDRLWTYATTVMKKPSGASAGYFMSQCGTQIGRPIPCLDPGGMEHLLMALLLANDHWGVDQGGVDYAAGAKDLLTVMRHKQDQNGGIVDGITDTFDAATHLVFDEPLTSSAGQTRPSIETPAFYELWAEAAADPFWHEAAASARSLWRAAANPVTGLMPVGATFDGSPVPGSDTFAPESYRIQINMVLDQIWTGGRASHGDEADRLLQFFIGKGISTYGREYPLDGSVAIDPNRDVALVVANGITGLIARVDQRKAFIDAVWNQDLLTGPPRYYPGILQMLGLLILSGKCRVY